MQADYCNISLTYSFDLCHLGFLYVKMLRLVHWFCYIKKNKYRKLTVCLSLLLFFHGVNNSVLVRGLIFENIFFCREHKCLDIFTIAPPPPLPNSLNVLWTLWITLFNQLSFKCAEYNKAMFSFVSLFINL